MISDFGGVLTTPLVQSFAAVQDETGIPFEELAKAMGRIEEEDGKHPLYELEKGNLTEVDFLTKLGDALEPALGHRPELHRFREIYFEALHPNPPMIELMREAKAAGHRMGMLTNNVREWEPLWRAMLPVDEIFETVVDSGFVGCRKPEPRDLRAHPRAARRRSGRAVPLRRRRRRQLRGRPRARHVSRPLPAQRAGDPGDPGGAGPLSAVCSRQLSLP